MKKLLLVAAVLVLTACGGGSGGSDSGAVIQAPVTVAPKPPESVLGGTPSAPVFLGLDSKNVINNNSFNNYFKYAGLAGERLVIRVNLTIPMSDLQRSRCSASPDTNGTQVYVYNSNNVKVSGVCGEDLTYTFNETGTFIFNFEFPSNDSGFFNAASLKGDAPVKFLEAGTGSPSEPKKINTASANLIGSNTFLNYYWISAAKGETIVVNTLLNQPLSGQQKARCGASPEGYNTQILVYNAKLNRVGLSCGETIRFQIPENGNYVFQFNYGSQILGTFNAAKI